MTLPLLLGLQALMAAGLGACVYLFASFKHDLRTMEKRWIERLNTAQADAEHLRAELIETRDRLRQTEENAGLLVAPQAALSGFNLGKRSQAIRMFRRGEKSEHIAAALRLPAREVELLLKVHRIVLNAPAGETVAKG
ncbi:MAG TPA: hypothetical protein VHA11_00620 [Bryobacteraceae bacterium]|nr:hypothetical protein [Bryobacteraceae bacterium]